MAKTLDLILVGIALCGGAAMLIYKLILMHRYRDDPEKLDALVSSDQVYPKKIRRFIFDDDYNDRMKSSKHEPGSK